MLYGGPGNDFHKLGNDMRLFRRHKNEQIWEMKAMICWWGGLSQDILKGDDF